MQMLEELPMVLVRRPEVLLVEPGLIRRDEPGRRELRAQECMAEYDCALLGIA